jgi:hypothetical protein
VYEIGSTCDPSMLLYVILFPSKPNVILFFLNKNVYEIEHTNQQMFKWCDDLYFFLFALKI